MRQDDLDEYLDREPFQPFRLYLSTGAFVDIRQPQLTWTTRSTLTLGQAIVRGPAAFPGYRFDTHRLA